MTKLFRLVSIVEPIMLSQQDHCNMQETIGVARSATKIFDRSAHGYDGSMQYERRQKRIATTREDGWQHVVQRRTKRYWLS